MKYLLLFLLACDGTYEQKDLPVIPLGEICNPDEKVDYVTGCYVCTSGAGFNDCCRLRPEKFACSCIEIRGSFRWLAGFCNF